MEKHNSRSVHSLVIDIVDDLFLTKTATRIVAIIMARTTAAGIHKILEHKGVHKR
jgi:hypothetical protein